MTRCGRGWQLGVSSFNVAWLQKSAAAASTSLKRWHDLLCPPTPQPLHGYAMPAYRYGSLNGFMQDVCYRCGAPCCWVVGPCRLPVMPCTRAGYDGCSADASPALSLLPTHPACSLQARA